MPQSFDDEDDEDDDEEPEDDEDEEVPRPEEVSRPVPPRFCVSPAPRDVSRDTVSVSTVDSVGDFRLRFLVLALAVVGGFMGSRYACHIRADLSRCSKV